MIPMTADRSKKRLIVCLMALVSVWLPGQVLAEYLTVRVPVANIRSGPDNTKDILWKVEQNHPLDIIEKSGSWYRFRDFEGDEGWVHKSLLNNVPAVIAKKNKCNVRSGPGTDKNIVFTVEKGIPFKLVEQRDVWLHVVHADGDEGWIHKGLVWPEK